MDRLAYQNITTKNRNRQFDRFAHPTGEITSKSKINTQVGNYYLERQSKNLGDYDEFVTALNDNIVEDRHRTDANNRRLIQEPVNTDNFQRVYHPTLLTDQEKRFNNADRCGLGTRNRQLNSMAKNKNSPHEQNLTPIPKLNYPDGYDKLSPINMDMTSQLASQFGGLIDESMQQQINDITSHTQNPQTDADYMDRRTFQFTQKGDSYNQLNFQRPHSSNVSNFSPAPAPFPSLHSKN